ncbi:DNA-binding response regulator [Streptomyces sp. FT05W]|uniref:response regulator transcription factor n=1 Tax=[Kitasatospora] papulosa TaxID=1464011 RepID=UPI000D6F3A1B|nr:MULTISPECIES: LuxR C-terminal-related transcriptional regulator [Streptomyces]PWS49925.1 DNA-binding response regulator [Streptomyces sp. FT05W]WSI15621.1 LuxR C-terminal-related transcriptional regulator [[Kitasatospora] papulosa]
MSPARLPGHHVPGISASYGPAPVRVHVRAANDGLRRSWHQRLTRAGIPLAEDSQPGPGVVLLAAGRTVDEAVDSCSPPDDPDRRGFLVAAQLVSPDSVLRAVRVGARTILRTADAHPEQLVAAVHSAHHGDGRVPYGVLVRLLGTAQRPVAPAPGIPRAQQAVAPLTPRQTVVLTLVAEGHGNAVIARALSCSEHTVKNVIYELMARLQVRNRAHAVARAVRAGLI